MPVSIIIFEDNEQLRESLVHLLNTSEDYAVTGHYGHVNDAADIVSVYRPEIVIMDIDLPGRNGIEGVRMIKESRPETLVIMYTMFEDDEKLFDSLCAGANGYILKKTSPYKLFDAIAEVIAGGAPMSSSIARRVLGSFEKKITTEKYHITAKEKEVLKLLIQGYSVKLIAAEMNIAFTTARSHLKNIYHKLHVNCGKEAIAKVLKERIL